MLSTPAKDESSSAVPSPTTPSPPPPPPTASVAAANASGAVDAKCAAAGKKVTRQWEAWTHQEEESFFVALRHVGKNFDKITSKVQSKNKDQVRHYYYRLIRRINKLLGPGFSLDAKNTKDVNSAMLRWWSLLEKQSCSASKLHLKPRRFKTFVTALEHQLLKDRVKANQKKRPSRAVPVVVTPVARKSAAGAHQEVTKAVVTDDPFNSKLITGKAKSNRRQESSQASKKRRKGSDCGLSAAAIKRWEKAASAGVSLVAEAAEQVEREAFKRLDQAEANLNEAKFYPPVVEREADLLLGTKVTVMEGRKEDGKLRLQLYPVDETTRRAMEQDGLYPFLQLTLKPRKPISSVVRHLIQKWGQCSAAVGEFCLFPFNAQVENNGGCKSWSLSETNVNAGDVFSSLGNPSMFRLRYGWLSSRILQSAQADYARVETRFQIGASSNAAVLQSSHTPSNSVCCANSGITFHPQSGEAVHNGQPFVEPIGLQDKEMLPLPNFLAQQTQGVVTVDKGTSISCVNHMDGIVPMDLRNTVNTFGQADSLTLGDNTVRDISGQRVQESADNVASWLYDGSNDSFIQRIWAIQDSPGAVAASSSLPSDIDWADTLTNISVGEFLNEVSQAGQSMLGLGSGQALQPIQSLDSFDAAVAVHSGEVTGIESKLTQNAETCAWDGEETCDAFAFQRLVSQRRISPALQESQEPTSSAETLREQDGLAAQYVDCGSLEAWKQSFSHAEPSFPEDLKLSLNSQYSSQQLEFLLNGSSTQDFTWANVQALSGCKDDPSSSKPKHADIHFEPNAEKVLSSTERKDDSHAQSCDKEPL